MPDKDILPIKLNLNGLSFTVRQEVELLADNQFGFDVTIEFGKNQWGYDGAILHNVTELHFNHEPNVHAFESEIHLSGNNYWKDFNIKSVKVEESKKKYDYMRELPRK